MKKIFLIGIVLFSYHLGIGQKLVNFSTDKEEFIKQLSGVFNEQRKGTGKDLIEKQFEPLWVKNPVFSADQEKKIIETLDLMWDLKIKVFPDFERYIQCLIAYNEKAVPLPKFMEWHGVLHGILNDKKMRRHYGTFLETSLGLFNERKIYESEASYWCVNNLNYQFKLDSIPHIDFTDISLKCVSKGDSSVIHQTDGTYFPVTNRFKGIGGKVYWTRAGLDPATTYAEVPHYTIKIKTTSYIIDSATFYTTYFQEPLLGKLQEKILAGKDEESASYPKFESYSQRFEIENIVPGVNYSGGFTMSGAKFNASGTPENPARLIFLKDNKPFLITSGLFYELKPDRFISSHVKIKFIVDKDSIIHPDLNLNFTIKTRELVLSRSELGLSKSPFTDTYHNTDLYFESIIWKIDEAKMKFGATKGSTAQDAAFESVTFFSKKRFTALNGLSSENPLSQIQQCLKAKKKTTITTFEIAEFTKLSEEDWHMVVIDLSNKGFVLYDIDSRIIRPLPKLNNYIANYNETKDYDILQFNSTATNGENGIWNLLNNDFQLKGIDMFYISDTQQVRVFPSHGEITLKKNRNLIFDGLVKAGNLEFMGNNYFFDYEKFQIEMSKIEYCQIYIDDKSQMMDQFGKYPKLKIKSQIKNITGVLYIDAPTNKSGSQSKKYPQYPYITTSGNSFVDWDSPQIQQGRYPKDKFYYKLDPFTLDSLDNFKNENVKFNGLFVSANIFEDIDEPLILMADNSLGFKRSTGPNGYPSYRGFSNVTADLTLNYSGLQGKGSLQYLSSKTESDAFVFLPDETKGTTSKYVQNEKSTKPEVPKTNVNVAQLNYYPQKDKLVITTLEEPIVFFEKEATMKGSTTLSSDGLIGKGAMQFYDATLSSLHFKYDRRKVHADTSSLTIAGKDMGALAISTDNVQAHVDFDKNIGRFISNTGETKITFPTNLYICYMDEFTWFMKSAELELKSSREANSDIVINAEERKRASNFYSIASGQDSLNFLSSRAKFDIAKSKLTCDKIKDILVGDALIAPDSGRVVIEKYADMNPLHRALITTSAVTKYHNLFNGELKIEGRKKYSGTADMAYIDENTQSQIIHFDEVKLDTAYRTIGKGEIQESQNFYLSPQFAYYGKFSFISTTKNLMFRGGVRIEHACDNLEKSFFKFESYIDPLDIYIPVDTVMKDVSSRKLGVGMMVKSTSPAKVYPAFLSPKLSKDDTPLLEANGYLHYDKNSKKFFIGSKAKIIQPKIPGNLIELNSANCDLNADGAIDFHARLGMIEMKNFGNASLKKQDESLKMQSATTVHFPFDESALKKIVESLEKNTELPAIDISTTPFEKSLGELMGVEKSDKIITEINLTGQFKKVPEELQKNFVFADLKWVWDVNSETFHTVGPIGIANIDKKQIFKYVTGKIEIEKRKTADVMRLYIEVDRSTWYYFEYKLGVMTVITGDSAFSQVLSEIKDDKKKFEAGKEKFSYQLLLTKKKRDDFRNRFPDDFPQ